MLYFVAATLLLYPVTAVGAGIPEGGVLEFDILRNGAAIGRHVYRFERRGDPLVVRIEAKIDYRFAFIPLYLFHHEAREVWRDGRLIGMTAETDDNGDSYRIEVRPDGDKINLSVNGVQTLVDPGIVPASLWNIGMIERRLVLDPADGELMTVSIVAAGEETIEVRGRDTAARRFVMTGDFERDLWYDRDDILVQVRFKGDDGSEIRYRLR
jgi:hypothetical protein